MTREVSLSIFNILLSGFLGGCTFGVTYILYLILQSRGMMSNKQQWILALTGTLLTLTPFVMVFLLIPKFFFVILPGQPPREFLQQMHIFSLYLLSPLNFLAFFFINMLVGKICIQILSEHRFLALKYILFTLASILLFSVFILYFLLYESVTL